MFTKQFEITGHSAGVYALDSISNFIYSGAADGFVARWLIDQGIQDKFAIKMGNPVYSLRLINDQSELAVGLSNGDLHFFSLAQKAETHFFKQHKAAIFYLLENPTQQQIYAVDANGFLSVWESTSKKLLLTIQLSEQKIRRIFCDENGKHLFVAKQDGEISVFETTFFNEIQRFYAHKEGATSLVLIDENQLISGGKDAILRKWNWETGTLINEIPAHNYAIYDLLALNKQFILSASRDKSIKVWDQDLNFIQKLDFKWGGHKHSVNVLKKHSETEFISGGDDKKIIFWRIEA